MNEEIATVSHWVEAAVDGLNDINQSVDENSVYSVLKAWARAPDISRSQVAAGLARYSPTTQEELPF